MFHYSVESAKSSLAYFLKANCKSQRQLAMNSGKFVLDKSMLYDSTPEKQKVEVLC